MTDYRARFAVNHHTVDGVHRIAVDGEIDYRTAPRLAAVLDALPGAEAIALDLAAVPFCDSAGLAVLVSAHHRMTAAGGDLRLVAMDPNFRRTLELTGLAGLFGTPG